MSCELKNDSDLWQVTNNLIAESCSTEFRLGQFVLPLRDRMNLTLFRSCFSAKFGSPTRLFVLFVNWICQLVVGGIVKTNGDEGHNMNSTFAVWKSCFSCIFGGC